MKSCHYATPPLPVSESAPKSRAELFVSVAPNHNGENIDLFVAETLIPGVRVPSVFLASKGVNVYPVELPVTRAGFGQVIAYRAVYLGEIHSAEEWCQILAADGVGHKSKATGVVRPISESTFRAEWNDFAVQTKFPLSSRAKADGLVGFGLVRDPEQYKAARGQLVQRATRMAERYKIGLAVADNLDAGWFEGQRKLPSTSRWSAELVARVVRELEKTAHTNGQIALMLASGKTITELKKRGQEQDDDLDLLTPRERARYRAVVDSGVREFLRWLALAGIPVCGGAGSWIAKDRQEFREYLGHEHSFTVDGKELKMHTGLLGRVEAVIEHANDWPLRQKIWAPATPAQVTAGEKFFSAGPRAFALSARGTERRRLRAEAEQGRRQSEATQAGRLWLEEARAYVERNGDAYLAIKDQLEARKISGSAAAPLTDRDRLLKARFETARKVLKMKYPKQQKIKAGIVPMSWEICPDGAPAIKTKAITSAAAADLIPW